MRLRRSATGRCGSAQEAGGLGRFDGSRFERYGTEAGLASDSVVAIADAGDGTLCFGTSRGVDLFDPKVRRQDGARGSVVRHFDNRNGLVSNECLTSSAIARARNGTLWFATSNGVTELRPSVDSAQRPAPEASVRRVVASRRIFNAPFATTASPTRNGEEWISSSPLVLRPEENSVHVEFRSMSYGNPGSVRYSVRLAPFDTDWLEETSVPFKEYTNLPPGTYGLRVRSRVERGP